MRIVWRREEDYLRAAPLMALSAGKVSVPSLRRASPPPRATSGECRISRLLPTPRKKPAQGGLFCVAQRRGLSAGCALDGFVGGKGFCPFSAPCFAASARDLRGMPDFSPSPHATQKTRARRAFLRGAEKRIRTSGRVTPVTRFPIVLLKPLRHLCK